MTAGHDELQVLMGAYVLGGLSEADHVTAGQREGNDGGLNRGRMLEADAGNRVDDGLAEAEGLERFVGRVDRMLRNTTCEFQRNTLTYTPTFSARTARPIATSIPRVNPEG